MLRDYVLELVSAPGTGTITLPGVAPTGRVTWAAAFVSSLAQVFYFLDDSTQQEWGYGALTVGAPSTITRVVVLGNSAGTTAKLNFTDTSRCYNSMPAQAMLAGINNAIGRNRLYNGAFEVRQRGNGPFTTVGTTRTADMWVHQSAHSNGSFSDTAQTFSDANRTLIGDESADVAYVSTFTGGTGAADFDTVSQNIENVRLLAAKTVTISFWAFSAVAGVKVGVEVSQSFGSGGSPSTLVSQPFGSVTLTAGFSRYTVTATMPSIAAKTLGTNNDHLSQCNLWLSAGSSFNTRASLIGVQSGTVTLWGVQLEIGSTPTPLDRRPFKLEIALCQRSYQTGTVVLYGTASVVGSVVAVTQSLLVLMRAVPTVGSTFTTSISVTGTAVAAASTGAVQVSATTSATGSYGMNATFTASAEL